MGCELCGRTWLLGGRATQESASGGSFLCRNYGREQYDANVQAHQNWLGRVKRPRDPVGNRGLSRKRAPTVSGCRNRSVGSISLRAGRRFGNSPMRAIRVCGPGTSRPARRLARTIWPGCCRSAAHPSMTSAMGISRSRRRNTK